MAKKVAGYIKLQVPAGAANPSPPIGPALGQRGLNIMEFCKTFNAQTQNLEPGMPIPVVITAYADRSFTFVTKTPPSAYFLKKAAGIENVDTGGGYEFDLLDHAIRAAIDGLGVTIADRHMITRELAEGKLVQVLNVHVDGHQSYWLVTRVEQDDLPQVAVFRDWLKQEIWLSERALDSSMSTPTPLNDGL